MFDVCHTRAEWERPVPQPAEPPPSHGIQSCTLPKQFNMKIPSSHILQLSKFPRPSLTELTLCSRLPTLRQHFMMHREPQGGPLYTL